ncbi:MAG: hypothetical protein JOZ69_03795, partial [Myxococcales bacterium]|nr:hypothetical protein [Myxococcales bacterium]
DVGSSDGPAAGDAPATEAGSACDQDGDGDLAPGGTCGGTDCDDHDPRAYFGEPSFLTFAPTPVTNGDWNCDSRVEKEFPANVTCSLVSLSACDTTAGFTGDPACGASGTLIQCQSNGLLGCTIGTSSPRVQGCR